VTGSNNTFLGYNTLMYGASYIVGSIALGANARITGYNQLMVAPNVTQFNISSLIASTETSVGTILEGPHWIPVSLFKVAGGCQSMVMPGDQVLQEL